MSPALKKAAWIIVAVVGIAFIGIGVIRGEMDTVFMKAVNVCLECIGIE